MPRPTKNRPPPRVADTQSAQLTSESGVTSRTARLLDPDSDSGSGSDSDGVEPPILKFNEEYARRFEHNKRREELQRLEEKYGSYTTSKRKRNANDDGESDPEESSSSSEDEDDVGVLATEDLDEEIAATLEAIRRKDPRVYDGKTQFYAPIDTPTITAHKKEKPMYLRDYHRENLLSGKIATEENIDQKDETVTKSYVEQQKELQSSVIKEMHSAADVAASGSEDDEEGFLVRKPGADKNEEDGREKTKDGDDLPDPATADPSNPDEYLNRFIASRAWTKVKDSTYVPLESDDSESDAKAEEFEYAYNMRFEDPDAAARAKLVSYGRDAANAQSVRREEKSRRKKGRDEKRKRKEEEKAQRDEERRRLRNLKAEEMMGKFQKVQEAAGLEELELEAEADVFAKLLEGDFNDCEWEAWMQERFGEKYYKEGDSRKKPEFDDDINIKDLVPNFNSDEDEEMGEEDAQEEQVVAPEADDRDTEEEDEENAEDAGGSTQTAKHKPSRKNLARQHQEQKARERSIRRKLERFVEDNFDADAAVGEKKSTFRYRETTPETFGLTPLDILAAGDAELNQFAGLKKYAAFRDREKKEKDRQRLKKKRLKKWRKEVFGDPKGIQMPTDWRPQELVRKDEEEADEKEGERKKKRRRKNKGKEKEKTSQG